MKNNKNNKKLPTSTIVLDKLIFSCRSTVNNNFDYKLIHNIGSFFYNLKFGETELKKTVDPSKRYRHSYEVYYKSNLMGIIDFGLYNSDIYDDMLRFTVSNKVFYNYQLKYIKEVLNDLNLEINNFKQIDIAVDSYCFDSEKFLRSNLRNKNNTVKIIGRNIYDRSKVIDAIQYYHKGSLKNPHKTRTILIKKKKKYTSEIIFYNKTDEIQYMSNKDYILNFHKQRNASVNKIYRSEIRFYYEELRRYSKRKNMIISFDDLLNDQFLCDMFFDNIDLFVSVSVGKGRKKNKIQLVEKPNYLSSEGILQSTLPMQIIEFYNSGTKANFKMAYDNNELSISYDKNIYCMDDIKYELFMFKHNNLKRYLSVYDKI